MEFKTIEAYITYLVDTGKVVEPLEFIKSCSSIEQKLDLSFVEVFHQLVRRKDCCVPHTYLSLYGVVAKLRASTRMAELISSNKFEENIDYVRVAEHNQHIFDEYDRLASAGPVFGDDSQISSPDFLRTSGESQPRSAGRKPLGRPTVQYLFHPRAFKKCLIRSKNMPKYADYYLLLESALVYYSDYRLLFKERYIQTQQLRHDSIVKEKDSTIDRLELKLCELMNVTKQGFAEARELNTELKVQNNELKESVADIGGKLGRMSSSVNLLHSKLDCLRDTGLSSTAAIVGLAGQLPLIAQHTAAPSPARAKREVFTLCRLNSGTAADYYAMCRRRSTRSEGLRSLRRDYPAHEVIYEVGDVPNSRTLFDQVSAALFGGVAPQWTGSRSRFGLAGITEAQLIEIVRNVFESRKTPALEARAAALKQASNLGMSFAEQTHHPYTAEEYIAPQGDDLYELLGI